MRCVARHRKEGFRRSPEQSRPHNDEVGNHEDELIVRHHPFPNSPTMAPIIWNSVALYKKVLSIHTGSIYASRDLGVEEQEKEAEKFYHGAPGIDGQVSRFTRGEAPYDRMFDVGLATGERIPLEIKEDFHRDPTLQITIGHNLDASMLRRTRKSGGDDDRLSGRTIRNYIKAEAAAAKKFSVLFDVALKDGVVIKQGDDYTFKSGMQEEDFHRWILKKMYNWDKLFGKTTLEPDGDSGKDGTEHESNSNGAESDDDDDQDLNIFGELDEESEFRTS